MRRLVRNRIFLAVVAAWLAYWPVTLIADRSVLLEAVSGMIAAISAGIVCAYAPGAWSVLRLRPYKLTGADLLLLGVVVVQFSITLLFIWSWSYRLLGGPDWMVDHYFRGWVIYLLFIGNVLHLLAWDTDEKNHILPTKSWVHIGSLVAIGLGLAVLLMLTTGGVPVR